MYRQVKLATLAVFAVALVTAMPLAAGAAPADGMTGPVAQVDLGTHQVHWSPLGDYAGLRLTISGPEGVEQLDFEPGESPSFDLAAMSDVADGLYSWELRAAPKLDSETQKLLAQMRSDDSMGVKRQRPAGLPPADQLVQSGTFRVQGGVIVEPAEEAPAPELRVQGAGADHVTGDLGVVTGETVISGDLTVYNSLCVGFDCLTNETYGADTIRLKENNLRIHAEDTSAGSFPTTDWRLEFNSNLSGGLSYFRVIDASASRSIMTLEANAPSHSLYVDSAGRVGFGTQNPVVELHAVEGDTPTLRLEQDTSSGFGAQTWDLAGNETSFFVRDATGGSTLPFRIFPGESSNALVIRNDGVGIGTTSPNGDLHIVRAGEARYRLENTSAGTEWDALNDGNGDFVISLVGTGGSDFEIEQSGEIGNCGNPDHDFVISTGPGCTATPRSWIDAGDTGFSITSSRALKENLNPVEVTDILERLREIPVYEFDFIAGPQDRIGLMAEDFHSIFGRGSDTELSSHEVQLAMWLAIRALDQRDQALAAKTTQIESLTDRLQVLEEALRELRKAP